MSLIQITRQITHWIRECWRKVSSPLPSPTPPTHPQRLIKAVDNAQILLNFAIEDHRKIAPKIIDDLTTSISALNTGLASVPDQIVEGERAFWNAYEALSEAVAPVTAESVVHSRRQSHSFIRATPVPYAAIALVLFLGVVLLQWHSFEGTTLRKSLNDTETEVQKRIDEERKKSRDVRVANEQSKSKFTEIVRNGCSPDDEFPQPKNLKKLSVAQEAICQQLRKELADNRTTVRNLDDDKELLSQQLGRAQRIVDPRVELLDEWLVRFDHWLVCLNMISCFNKASVAENKGPGEIDKLKLMLDERQATIGALKATLETLRSERQNLFRANQPNSARYGSELEGKLVIPVPASGQ